MRPPSRSDHRLVARIVLLGGVLSAAPAARAEAPVAPGAVRGLLGVDLGSGPGALLAAARAAGVRCDAYPATPASAGRTPYMCQPLVAPPPFPATATYWYDGGRLTQVYLVGNAMPGRFAAYESGHRAAVQSFQVNLGAPERLDVVPTEWLGARSMNDSGRLRDVVAGRATLRARWRREGVTAEVVLRGSSGRVELVASVVATSAAASCDPAAVRDALLDLFPPADEATRARAARRLADCRVERAAGALAAAEAHDPTPVVRAEAQRALVALAPKPPAPEAAPPAKPAAPVGPLRAAAATEPAATGTATATELAAPGAPGAVLAGAATAEVEQSPEPAAKPAPPWSGTPLGIAASTIAGATLMRNLGLMGGQGLSELTPQLLLGSAGAVIGFGTSYGLSRFGLRPTVEQAVWFTNTTAWGTLAGLTAWSASGSTNPKLQYGALALGEAAGLGVGAFTAHKWRWSGAQTAVADGLVLSAALGAASIRMIRDETPQIGPADAIGLPLVMTAAAIATHQMSPTTNDLQLMTFGVLGSAWTGGLLVAGATSTGFLGSRPSLGGVMAGASAGFLGGAVLGGFSEVEGWRLGVASGGLLAGNVLGLGLAMSASAFTHDGGPDATFTNEQSNRWALGAGLGGAALSAAAYAYAPRLRPGPSATAMTIEGALYGAGVWWLGLSAAAQGPPSDVDTANLQGGLLAGAALGGITGLVSSRWFAPDQNAQVTTAASTALGMAGGLGVVRLATDEKGTPDFMGVTLGAGIGFAGGALAAHRTALRSPDLLAGVAGIGFGALVGTLAPTLGDDTWDGGRTANGGAWLGLAMAGAGATAAAHLAEADAGQVAVPTVGAGLGLLTGLGAGMLMPCDPFSTCTSQAPRIGTVAGTLGGAGLGLLLDRQLHLSEGLGPNAGTLGFWGGAFGIVDGLLLAGALDPSGVISDTPDRQLDGAALMLGSAELGAGLVLSKRVTLRSGDLPVVLGGRVAGGMIGLGATMLAKDDTGRADTLATLGGSLAGLGAAVATQVSTPLDAIDQQAVVLGAGSGAVLGTLAPTLGADLWSDTSARRRGGGFLLGLGAGAGTGAILRHTSGASGNTVGLTALGGADGLATGLGLGLLLEPIDSSRGARVGTFMGTAAGITAGALVLPRLELTGTGAIVTTSAGTAIGAWTGAWLPVLGHASTSEVTDKQVTGGLLAGAGLGTAIGVGVEAAVHPDSDLIADGVAVDAMFTAAGAGAGALASNRADAPVWGMLGAGTAGLVLGGALHRSMEIDGADAPLLTLATAEGLWLGGWLPTALFGWGETTSAEQAGGLVAGGAGALGLATLASGALELSPSTAGYTAMGSAIGASLGGGIALASPALHDRRGVGLMMGGTTLGLVAGAALAPRLALAPPSVAVGATAVGGTLGVAESLLFAWSARSDDNKSYGGAALIGGGIGATLGLATAAAPAAERGGNVPAAAGFAAWGAWMGSFSGSLVHNDPRESCSAA